MNEIGANDVNTRANILLDEANLLFNRLDANISYLGGKIMSFFGILIGLLSLQFTLIIIVIGIKTPTAFSYFLMFIYFIFTVISCTISVYLVRMADYVEIELFDEDRFKELSRFKKSDLLTDLLYFTKVAYEHNYRIYSANTKLLSYLYFAFLLENVFYILLITSILLRI